MHGERLTRAQAVRLVGAYARSEDYDRASDHMRGNVFTGAEEIDVPVTLAWGEHDTQVTPPREPPPGWRQVELRGCNHLPTYDDPEQVVSTDPRGRGANSRCVRRSGRYWARTSDLRGVNAMLSQLS